jgi:hypothetical protein
MNKYTDEMIAKMKEIGTFNYDSAKAFADANGLTFRSVIAKVRALELDYQPKDLKAFKATKAKARSKADIVNSIVSNLGQELDSLNKMTVKDLEVLETVLGSYAS